MGQKLVSVLIPLHTRHPTYQMGKRNDCGNLPLFLYDGARIEVLHLGKRKMRHVRLKS